MNGLLEIFPVAERLNELHYTTSGAKGQNIGIIEIHHALIGDYDKAGASPGNPQIPENRDRRAALRTDIAICCFGTGVAQSP